MARKPLEGSKVYTSIKDNTQVRFAHQVDSLPALGRIIKQFNPQMIIELGTFHGGGTLYLHELSPDTELHTFDIYDYKDADHFELFSDKVTFHVGDIFEDCKTMLSSLCADERRKFLYCDNGKKIEEFKVFSKFLNEGDMIGVHDWGTEIEMKDIRKALKNFTPHMHSVFKTKEWVTRLWKKNAE